MTTLRQIVIDAFRESNLVSAGETPDSAEFDEGLRKLTRFIDSVYGNEIGENLLTVNYGSANTTNYAAKYEDLENYIRAGYLPSNTRLMVNQDDATTIYLDPIPNDGAVIAVVDVGKNLSTNTLTVHGNGKNIEGSGSVILSTDGLVKRWFYREDLGEWVAISDLTANSELPFPSEFDEYFVKNLALRIHPQYGIETRMETMTTLRRVETHLRARYRQPTPVIPELALSRMDKAVFGFYDKSFELGRIR